MRRKRGSFLILVLLTLTLGHQNAVACGQITTWAEPDASLLGITPENVTIVNEQMRSSVSDRQITFFYLTTEAWNLSDQAPWRLNVGIYSYLNAADAAADFPLLKPVIPDWAFIDNEAAFLTYYQSTVNQQFGLKGIHQTSVVSIEGWGATKNLDVDYLRSQFIALFDKAKTLIDFKCTLSACGAGKVALPSEFEYFIYLHQDPEHPLDAVVLGTDPKLVRPLYLGNPMQGGVHFDMGFCGFSEPVDIYLAYLDANSLGFYYIDSNRKARYFGPGSTNEITPLLINLNQEAGVTLGGDFGGLFQDGEHLPKGVGDFFVAVVPTGASILGLKILWETGIKVACKGEIPVPDGKDVWLYPPAAVPGAGVDPSDPSKLRPLAVGPIALGENEIAMYVDTCPFQGPWGASVDSHFAVYCPGEDAANVYFFTKSRIEGRSEQELAALTPAQLDELLWEKVALSRVFDEFPQECWEKGYTSDKEQESESWLLKPRLSGGMPDSATWQGTYYMFAITPHGVRDKFYAWVTTLPVNVRHAISEQIRQ